MTTVADLEVLFRANVDDVEAADKQVVAIGKKIEANPIQVKADAKDALAGMERVEGAAKRLVSADTIVKLDADIDKAKAGIDRTKARLEDLQVKADAGLDVAADTRRATSQLQRLERSLKGLEDARSKIEVDADVEGALKDLARVRAAERTVSADVVAKVDADITFAQKNVTRIQAQLEVLRSQTPTPKVLVDISRAEGQLDTAKRKLEQLTGARASMKVDADTSAAESALKQVGGVADKAGTDAGRSFTGSLDAATRGAGEKVGEAVGAGVEDTLIKALAAIPVAGGIVLGGVAIGKAITGAIQDGLNVEKSMDRLAALTGLGDADAQRIARAAGEAYANTFGDSIESNMDTARLALQFRIIDPKSTTRDAQEVVQGLAGIADVLGEDVRPVATAVTQLLRTGLAKSAKDAFDLLAAGARNGVNASEDMLDTLTEYPALFQRLGLSGPEALGLINQGLKAGARNSDLAADALKEFQIRATDGSTLSAQGFEKVGLSAEEMTAKIAAGGDGAREGLAQVLDGLHAIEDPVQRNAAAVALFGTQAEDLGNALFAMDLSSAVDQLDGVTGAAKRMFDTLSDNDATKIERAQRNIEVAADGIKAALAAAFSEPLGDLADWVSENRGPLTQFLLDLATGAIEFGKATVNAAADGTEAFGEFVSGPVASVVEGIRSIVKAMNPFADTTDLDKTIEGLKGFKDGAAKAADGIRDSLLPKLDEAKTKLLEWGDPVVKLGFLNDASLRLARSLDEVGVAADGSKVGLDTFDLANLSATENGRLLEGQIRASIGALGEQVAAAGAAGETQSQLAARYSEGEQALYQQLRAMGLTDQQAWTLIETYSNVPAVKATDIQSNAPQKTVEVDGLSWSITRLPDKSVQISVVGNAIEQIQAVNAELQNLPQYRGITVGVNGGVSGLANGAIMEFYAGGGVRDRSLTPMRPIAQMVPANTWRVVGDRPDVPEAYIPLDGSSRSLAILYEAMRRMGVSTPDGTAGTVSSGAQITQTFTGPFYGFDPSDVGREARDKLAQLLATL
ncbi:MULTISPECIES: phage tail tape measure protein [unclassified Microbacterium]|uniref:phage tail tape measure protein n=1 Tax=unclassified Microbacterium TaxID=2609290 RepID=UPI003647C761